MPVVPSTRAAPAAAQQRHARRRRAKRKSRVVEVLAALESSPVTLRVVGDVLGVVFVSGAWAALTPKPPLAPPQLLQQADLFSSSPSLDATWARLSLDTPAAAPRHALESGSAHTAARSELVRRFSLHVRDVRRV